MLRFLNYPRFSYFHVLVLIATLRKEIGRTFKFNQSKYPLQQ